MTDEQFNGLPERLQIWALRENAVIYMDYGIIPSPTSIVVKIPIEKDKDYPHAIHKSQLNKYNNVTIGKP